MKIRWHFNTVRPGDRARESQVEKFFQSDAVRDRSDAMIREGIQNSLDAAPDEKIVRIRLTLGCYHGATAQQIWERYSPELNDHIKADTKKLPQPPTEGESFRFIVFEDFETTGLKGDPGQWRLQEGSKNPYFNFFRAEGISDKEEGDRGRHGVGKFVFAAASRIRAMFGLTIREEDGLELLMGTTTLHYHDVNGKEFMPDGWYGIEDTAEANNTLPIEADKQFIDRFKRDFRLSRKNEPGLSIVVPWLDETVRLENIITSAIRGYYYPIMRNLLVVEVVDEQGKLTCINAQSIKEITQTLGNEFEKEMQDILELAMQCINSRDQVHLNMHPGNGKPDWNIACIPTDAIETMQHRLDSGLVLSLRIPIRIKQKDKGELFSEFNVYFQRDATGGESKIQFIREGIIITEVKPRRTSSIRGLVVIDQGPLASFLGDAENPSHTQWLRERVRGKYTFHGATLDYVIHAIPDIIKLLSHEQKNPDPLPMRDLFYLPEEPTELTNTKQKKRKSKGGDETIEPPIPIPHTKPRSYSLNKIQGGFVIRRDDLKAPLPASITLTLAYGRRQGNPFKKYDKADFRLDSKDIKIEQQHVNILQQQDNKLVIEPLNDQFEVRVTGFDTNRDLHIDPKVIKPETAEVEDAQTV